MSSFDNFFQNFTAFMVVEQGNKYQKNYVISVLELTLQKNVAIGHAGHLLLRQWLQVHLWTFIFETLFVHHL